MASPRFRIRRALLLCAATSLAIVPNGTAGAAEAADSLIDLSLEELMEMEVTSVSKRSELRRNAAAAVTVLTNEDIRRSGATSIPEALRGVPGLEVARIDANRWAISSRGFNLGFANKLLVMIDGRSVYTPLFSGVYWDIQDYPLEDIDRIEVIRGPGGTVWGANAVNGVINIITKQSGDTQGGMVSAYGGNQEWGGTGRVGGELGDKGHYRGYVRGVSYEPLETMDGSEAYDSWDQLRAGFRTDTQLSERDRLVVSGDYYVGDNRQQLLAGPIEGDFTGGNILARWTHEFGEFNTIRLQGYYDRTDRNASVDEQRNTVDVDFQHNLGLVQQQDGLFNGLDFVWGFDYRWTGDHTTDGATVQFDPPDRDLHLFDGVLQLQGAFFDDSLLLTLGTKLGYNSYTDFEYQPSFRALWNFFEGNGVWGAVSRAVRTPSRADRDIQVSLVTNLAPLQITNIFGSDDFRSEELLSFELGYRNYMLSNLSLDVSGFYSKYDDLASTEILSLVPPPPAFPSFVNLGFSNRQEAESWGVEVELNWVPTSFLRVIATYTYVKVDAEFLDAGLGTDLEGNDPLNQAMVRTLFNLPRDFEFDAAVYFVDQVPGQLNPAFPAPVPVDWYVRLDLRLGWQATDWLNLSVVGQNLSEDSHAEFGDLLTVPSWVPRSVYGKAMVTF